MAILLIADHDNSALNDTTLKALTAALQISPDVDVLVLGENAGSVAAAAATAAGVRKVLLIEGPALARLLAEAVTDAVVPLMGGYDAVATPATGAGEQAGPAAATTVDR